MGKDATVITDNRGNASRLRSSMRDREQCSSRGLWTSMSTMHRETSYTSREFPMLRKKRQYKHRNGDDCVTSIFSDASKIGTVLTPYCHTPLQPCIQPPWSVEPERIVSEWRRLLSSKPPFITEFCLSVPCCPINRYGCRNGIRHGDMGRRSVCQCIEYDNLETEGAIFGMCSLSWTFKSSPRRADSEIPLHDRSSVRKSDENWRSVVESLDIQFVLKSRRSNRTDAP
ncbi:hypothetical protein AVEN_136492-1 [Araneus ventricosus]|uniref:Uncharacterized protein n=1 Tax=Araneus ventricosus TaxID=182803 RepID=A0A4Y2QYZ8_ARAVE|nr:hypothetical protein AVEN_136492-1 [Araneus ventricosus]